MIRAVVRAVLLGRAIVTAAFRALHDPIPTTAPRTKRRFPNKVIEYAALFGVIGIVGFLGAALGIIPIRASAGHWRVTRWFLEFSMARSVSMHAMRIEVPRLDDPALVMRGAGAYESGCRPCHGSPELPHPRVARAMLPQPRYLPVTVAHWSPRELFYLVKHGVKFTGMPAWPSQRRDDEVWAVVAFLLRFPKLDAREYRLLVRGDPATDSIDANAAPRSIRDTCGRCHGVDGRGRGGGAFPKLAGQGPSYLFNAMRAFERGQRHSGIMEPIAAALSIADMREIAIHYGRMNPPAAPTQHSFSDAIQRGREIATRGIPAQRVPACADCHGPAPSKKNDAYPVLAGQYANYLMLQLQLFQEQRRGGSPYAHLMRPVAAGLTRQQMRDVAAYYESLGARGGGLRR